MRTVLQAPAAVGGRAVGRAVFHGAPASGFAPAGSPAAHAPGVAPANAIASPAPGADLASAHVSGSVEEERARFAAAMDAVKAELATLAAEESPSGAIFAAHLEILDDPMLTEQVEDALEGGLAAPEAVDAASEAICAMFDGMDDEYLRARMDDVRDVCRRLRDRLAGTVSGMASDTASGTGNGTETVTEEGIIVVADELFPSDTVQMDFSRVRALVTARGSVTSHVCIIARSKGIPALLGVDIASIPSGARLLVDAPSRRLVIDPSPDDLAAVSCREKAQNGHEPIPGALSSPNSTSSGDEPFSGALSSPISTPGGDEPLRRVPVYGNAGSLEDVRTALEAGADGIGLFRTEFLFMQSNALPTEEEQFATYKAAALLCGEKPLTIRTLDIGGDKALPYLRLPREENPYLGIRALRLCLARPEELFKPQLRAILRASAHGNVRILLPMVTSVGEVRAVRRLLAECMRELDAAALPYAPAIPTGVMVETPAAALIAGPLAQEADFFSIGTNDLTQYILAADRGNPAVAAYYDSMHPAVLRAIAMAVAAAHGDANPAAPSATVAPSAPVPSAALEGQAGGDNKAGRRIPVGVCGEMAADAEAAATLLSLGVDSLSLSSAPGVAGLKRRM